MARGLAHPSGDSRHWARGTSDRLVLEVFHLGIQLADE